MFVEALSAEHYRNADPPGAISLPYELVDEAEERLPDKEAEVDVYHTNVHYEPPKSRFGGLRRWETRRRFVTTRASRTG